MDNPRAWRFIVGIEFCLCYLLCYVHAESCGAIKFLHSTKMDGHTLRSVTGVTHAACALECYVLTDCLSINYLSPGGTCELNSEDTTTAPSSMHAVQSSPDANYMYSDISQWPPGLAGECAHHTCPARSRCSPGKPPTCVQSKCPAPPNVENAEVEAGDVAVGTSRTYHCLTPQVHTLLGTNGVTCQANAQWSPVQFECGVCAEFSWTSGTNVVWSYTTVNGEQVVTLSCAAKFAPFQTGISAAIHCLDTGVWEYSAFACAADTIGHECSESSTDCMESDSLCVREKLSETTGICMCEHMFRYDAAARTCTRVCTTLQDTFTVVPWIRILHHSLYWKQGLTIDECRQRCIQWGDDCLSFATNRDLYCWLKYVQLDQVNDSIPSIVVEDDQKVDLHVRDCV